MNILMLNYEYPPIGGGAANANYYLLKEFKGKKINVDLVTSGHKAKKEKLSKNITIHKISVKKDNLHYWKFNELLSWSTKAYFFTRDIVKKNKYDLCHCWFGWPTGIIGYLNRKKVPYIIALRGSDVPGYNPRLKLLDNLLFKKISRVVWKNAEKVVTLSEDLSDLASNTLECDFEVIHNGVDTEEFYPSNKDKKHFKLLFVGRLIERKGVKYILHALSDLIETYPKIKLTIVGTGNLENSLRNLAKDLNLENNVTFLGRVDHGKLPEIYRKHDIFILPSINEALGNVTHEAIASGLAIITTRTGAAELLDDNGIIIKKNSSKDIKENIEYLINNKNILNKFKKKSAELAKKMSWKETAEKYINVYKKCLK